MKARTESKEQQIILSIGMIVKNEEKVLERCLKSLQPLMKAIPSELIIADTGSTDSTFEIAKKYTDNVYHFEWINDFGAARNSTLEKAKGIWYFFLDADEYLDEDIHEIVEFFKIPELYNHYKCAQINLRNYLDPMMTKQATVMLPRFHRIANCEEKVRFVGAIHETIYMRNPLGYFQTILNHTGYAFASSAQKQKKFERNLELMREEYKETKPNERFRIICHLIDCLFEKPEEAEQYITEALGLIRNNRYHFFSRSLFLQAINFYINNDLLKARELCDEYFALYPDYSKYIASVGVMQRKAEVYAALGNQEEAYKSYVEYFKLYEDYKNEKLDISDLAAHNMNGVKESEYIKSKSSAINCLIKLYDYEEAFKLLDSLDFENDEGGNLVNYLSSLKNISIKSRDYKRIAYCYDTIAKTGDENKINLILNTLEGIFYTWTSVKDRTDYASQLVESGVKGPYIDLMNLYLNQQKDFFKSELKVFLDLNGNWKSGFSEAIFLAVKYKIDFSKVVLKIDSSQFGKKISLIANTHDEFADLVLEYGVPEQFLSNIKLFDWILIMHEAAAYRSFELNDDKKYELYLRFTTLLGEYISNIYNPELLEDESDAEVLPELHRFGYYMLKANRALAEGDSIEYIRGLKKALVNCESMKGIVKFLMEQFKRKTGM